MYNFISYKKRIFIGFSAPLPVQAARRDFVETCAWADSGGVGTCGTGVRGLCSPRFQPCLLRNQSDPAVFQHEAGDAGPAIAAGVVEYGAVVAQSQELLQKLHVRADVYELIAGAAFGLPFDEAAVGAAGHTVDLNHG